MNDDGGSALFAGGGGYLFHLQQQKKKKKKTQHPHYRPDLVRAKLVCHRPTGAFVTLSQQQLPPQAFTTRQ